MRFAIAIAAFGFVASLPVAAPVFTPAALAQTTATAEERALEAQIVALAQAGNVQGIRLLLAAQVRAGKSATLARVARRVAVIAEQIAATDADGAASLVNAAVIVASNPSVAASDTTVSNDVGTSAQNVVQTVQTTDPQASASIQVTVASEGSTDVQTGFVGGTTTTTTTETPTTTPTTTTTTTTTQQQTGSTTPVVVTPVIIPTEPETPVPVEPNPAQSGSPT